MPEKWPRFEELPHHLTDERPMPGYISGVPGRRAVLSEAQYEQARRSIEERAEMIEALTTLCDSAVVVPQITPSPEFEAAFEKARAILARLDRR